MFVSCSRHQFAGDLRLQNYVKQSFKKNRTNLKMYLSYISTTPDKKTLALMGNHELDGIGTTCKPRDFISRIKKLSFFF